MRTRTLKQLLCGLTTLVILLALAPSAALSQVTVNLPDIILNQSSSAQTGSFDVFLTSLQAPTIGDYFVDVILPAQSAVTFSNPFGSPSQNASALPSSSHPYVFGAQIPTSGGSANSVQATDFALSTPPTLVSGQGLLRISYYVAANAAPQTYSLGLDSSSFLDDGNGNPLSLSVSGGSIKINPAVPEPSSVVLAALAGLLVCGNYRRVRLFISSRSYSKGAGTTQNIN
jgi:hypothetical protein